VDPETGEVAVCCVPVEVEGEAHNVCCVDEGDCADCGDHGPDDTCEPIDAGELEGRRVLQDEDGCDEWGVCCQDGVCCDDTGACCGIGEDLANHCCTADGCFNCGDVLVFDPNLCEPEGPAGALERLLGPPEPTDDMQCDDNGVCCNESEDHCCYGQEFCVTAELLGDIISSEEEGVSCGDDLNCCGEPEDGGHQMCCQFTLRHLD